jgi:hypothetical protein
MMARRFLPLIFCLIFLISVSAIGQDRRGSRQAEPQPPSPSAAQSTRPSGGDARKDATETQPVVTHHEIHVGGRVLHYTATAG